jgi:hypothetical protein
VDEENLPVEFGGKCRCEKYGGCWKGAGPWLNAEVVEVVDGEVKVEVGEVGLYTSLFLLGGFVLTIFYVTGEGKCRGDLGELNPLYVS